MRQISRDECDDLWNLRRGLDLPTASPATEHQPTAIFSEVQLCVDNVDVKVDIYFANRPLAHAEDALRVYKLCHVCSCIKAIRYFSYFIYLYQKVQSNMSIK